ncbi:hypothetical protein HaLaN_14365 [Haematococcus lacustris]|uniref:Uncharacterized protein n=1 Tax=Haematococcus lacustris TaxID=44745 RepID=A0A699Z6E8_HAELA|nr:hypothetical protein HaLaN_14365 [Haematococcus lacustris]
MQACKATAAAAGALLTKRDKKDKGNKMKYSKDALFLLKWQPPSPDSAAPEALKQLAMDMKPLEKIVKDAVWFTVKDSGAGKQQQLLVVTNDSKKARKYGLPELTEANAVQSLEGSEEPVVIPVAALKAALMQEDSSSSDSSDEDDAPHTQPPVPTKLQAGAAHGAQAAVLEVTEDPEAARQAAALVAGAMAGLHAQLGEGEPQRKKLKDVVKAERRLLEHAGQALAAGPQHQELHKAGKDDSSESTARAARAARAAAAKVMKSGWEWHSSSA